MSGGGCAAPPSEGLRLRLLALHIIKHFDFFFEARGRGFNTALDVNVNQLFFKTKNRPRLTLSLRQKHFLGCAVSEQSTLGILPL